MQGTVLRIFSLVFVGSRSLRLTGTYNCKVSMFHLHLNRQVNHVTMATFTNKQILVSLTGLTQKVKKMHFPSIDEMELVKNDLDAFAYIYKCSISLRNINDSLALCLFGIT